MFASITDEEINEAEQLLLPAGKHFSEEARAIIRCNISVDVNACPGSGKTTLILAKLMLIAKQLPLDGNKGICVLTHTNVAIDEIIDKLGHADNAIFRYPNHFGTIQSFINKFLGVPGYTARFPGSRVSIMDEDFFMAAVERRFRTWRGAGKTWISTKPNPIEYLQSFRFNADLSSIVKSNNTAIMRPGPALTDIYNFRYKILKDGILNFDDAYLLAEYYLNRYPAIAKLIRDRFPVLMLDEMQDTDALQLSLLNKIFDPATAVIQRIGDSNQAIFNKVDAGSVWPIGGHVLPLTGSLRFSDQIALQIDKICLLPRNMRGNPIVANIQPRILLFSQDNIEAVVERYCNLLIELDISNLSKQPCKAVGWTRETTPNGDQVKNCIRSYWPTYEMHAVNKKMHFQNLSEYFIKPDAQIISLKGANYYLDKILLVFLKIINIAEVVTDAGRFYSKTSLYRQLKGYAIFFDLLGSRLIKWIKEIHQGNNVTQDIREFIVAEFLPLFNIEVNPEIDDFLNDANVQAVAVVENPSGIWNGYKHKYTGAEAEHAGKEIIIQVSTIHKVKGETHAATLYMETFNYADDIRRILRYYKIGLGAAIPAVGVRVIESLKMAYVAMSRPQYFLCIALRNNEINQQDINELENAGWYVDQSLV
jgi:DNA helicase-2/ATP-dependent DNA helicase PcrA